MQKKSLYKKPEIIELNAFSASGQQVHPTGECVGGSYPYYDCVTGPAFQATCGGGSTPDTSQDCSFGGYATVPTCRQGGSAVTVCLSGLAQN